MLLDIGVREIDGELCLAKFAPKSPDASVYAMDDQGYIKFSIENFSWQKIDGVTLIDNKIVIK